MTTKNDFDLDEMLEDYVEDIRNRENWDISFEEYKKNSPGEDWDVVYRATTK